MEKNNHNQGFSGILLIVIVLILFALAGGIYYYYQNYGMSNLTPTNQTDNYQQDESLAGSDYDQELNNIQIEDYEADFVEVDSDINSL